jgi:hypothetical protein
MVQNYAKRYLLLDLLASIPFDYLLELVSGSEVSIRYFRLLRLLKIYRIGEILDLVNHYTSINVPLLRVSILACIMVLGGHLFNCILLLFARWEIG